MHVMQLSEKLRILCLRYDLTQEQFGAQLGIAQTTVGRWLKGTARPYGRNVDKLAELYQLTREELLDDKVPLPVHIIDGRGQILKRAAEHANSAHPGNAAAAQEAFDAHHGAAFAKLKFIDFSSALRAKAKELLLLADQMEAPENWGDPVARDIEELARTSKRRAKKAG